ncbi:spermidine synthase [Litorilituus lipolyticus]|uniref:Polyamine aminopropyltransferase n=1 Tax=Litorilituus lipolyticus TaxID=2491017 RepID=A0A502KZN1_9GAMM|nr:fused MFS/spermidine synthase [Litorilituus lipolyticus]TPH15123.1 methyltransferase domain-containing protein [Litorilituus lipolyticus]
MFSHNTFNFTLITTLGFLLLISLLSQPVSAKVVHKERSLYRNILIEDKGDLRCLKFNVKSSKTQQSCFLKSQPERLYFNYTKLLLSSLLINPNPEKILIIGLGGGTMSNTLHQLLPDSQIDNIEIDNSVIKVAREYFKFFENDHIKAISQDGRVFVKRALLKKQQYDWIILDAFNGDYIPEHLMTKEFLEEIKNLLTPQGVLTANTFSVSKLYDYESATYKDVFGDFYQVRNLKNSNRVILAMNPQHNVHNADISAITKANVKALEKPLKQFGVDIQLLVESMSSTKNAEDWPRNTPVLTDQFAPANLLNMK